LASKLSTNGWRGSAENLHDLFVQGQEDAALRVMVSNWRWGEGSKRFVLSLISCARKRQARVRVLNEDLINPGSRVQMTSNNGGYVLLSPA
jgi:hypothetical protein